MIKNIILASKSEIRKKVLEKEGFDVRVEVSSVDEDIIKDSMKAEGATSISIAKSLAEHKANRVSSRFSDLFVLGADQVLDFNNDQINKPNNLEEARFIMTKLQGQTHLLHSAVCVSKNGSMIWNHHETSTLKMKTISPKDLELYLEDVGIELMQKYGVYQIEGKGKKLFEKIDGDMNAIMGMPIVAVTNYFNQRA
jgi:septum formation protein